MAARNKKGRHMTAVDANAPESDTNWLAHFPITFFGSTMGVFGFGLALHAGGFEQPALIAAGVGAGFFALFALLYLAKALRHPSEVAAEWSHPVRLSFFPAANISLLLLSLLLRAEMPEVARILWLIAAPVQALLTVVIVSAWISHRPFGPGMLSPAWFIPAVGNVIVPLGGVSLGYAEVSWYFFSVGLLFWFVLLTLVFNRLVFHDPLPGKLRPTLVILIAPPAVAYLAWLQLNGGGVDALARVLFNLAIFFAAIVLVQLPALLRLPFAMSFWALSFPLAALTTASFRHAALTGSVWHGHAALALLAILAVTIVALAARTVRAAIAGQICLPE
jgi:tellurite resistance protein